VSAPGVAGGFPIRYVVHGGRPAVDLVLVVEADASYSIEVRTEQSLPQSPPLRLGRFAGRIEPDALQALVRVRARARVGNGGVAPFETISRLIGSGTGQLETVGPDDLDAVDVDNWLATTAVGALESPVAAVAVEAAAGDGSAEELVITAIGREPFRLVVFDPEQNTFPTIWRDLPGRPGTRAFVEYDVFERLASAGAIPVGVTELEPGESIRLPLPPAGAGQQESRGGFVFYQAGDGPARAAVSGTWSGALAS
jgi:hypothetical protein